MRGPDKKIKRKGSLQVFSIHGNSYSDQFHIEGAPLDISFPMTIRACLCFQCVHNWGPAQWERCRAFPKGIPNKYLYGGVRHNRVVKGQVGNFVFQYFDKGI